MDACDDMEVLDADGMIINVLENGGINYTVDVKKHIWMRKSISAHAGYGK